MSATEFLAHALSPQGSADLPYKPEQLWTVRQHISDLVEVLAVLRRRLAPSPPSSPPLGTPGRGSTPPRVCPPRSQLLIHF